MFVTRNVVCPAQLCTTIAYTMRRLTRFTVSPHKRFTPTYHVPRTRNRPNETDTEQHFNHSIVSLTCRGIRECFKNKLFFVYRSHCTLLKAQNHKTHVRAWTNTIIFSGNVNSISFSVTVEKGETCIIVKSRRLFDRITRLAWSNLNLRRHGFRSIRKILPLDNIETLMNRKNRKCIDTLSNGVLKHPTRVSTKFFFFRFFFSRVQQPSRFDAGGYLFGAINAKT